LSHDKSMKIIVNIIKTTYKTTTASISLSRENYEGNEAF